MFSTPINYPAPESLSIPSCLVGEEQKSFRNCKSVIKSIPAASGSGTGPSSTMLFSIPNSSVGFIKPSSVCVRMKISVALTGAAGVTWKFAGNSSGINDAYDWGGASSIINRVNISTSGVTMSYPNYNTYRNAVLPHVLTPSYFTDLKQMEFAGTTKLASTDVQACKDVYVTIPLFVGCFNAATAFPLCLLSSATQVELLTETVTAAFSGAGANAITSYTVSEATLVYEEIQVEPSFVQALKSSKAGQSFNFRVNDYISVGPWSPAQSERFTIGAGLSSLKSILYTSQLQSCLATSQAEKNYVSNGLAYANFYVDGQQVSLVNQTDESIAFTEMQRALQRINDSNTTSFLEPVTNVSGGGLRTSYTTSNFLLGASTMTISDWGFSQSGIPASMVQVELNASALSDQAVRWGTSVAYNAAVNAYAYLLYDSQYVIDINTGMLSIKK